MPLAHRTNLKLGPGPLALGLLAALMVATVMAVPFVQSQLRWREFHAAPPIAVLPPLCAFGALATLTARLESRRTVRLLLAGLLTAMHLAVVVQPLGDWRMWVQAASSDVLFASELLANLLHRCVRGVAGESFLPFVAPAAGMVTSVLFLRLVDTTLAIGGPADRARGRLLGAAVLALSGVQLLCFRGFLENTLPSLPFAIAGLGHLVRFARGEGEAALRRASAWLAVAFAVHGVNAAMLCALIVVVVAFHVQRGSPRAIARSALVAATIVASVLAAIVVVVTLLGFEIRAGHVTGGGDGGHFVPFARGEDAPYAAYLMLDREHFAAVGNILLLTSPLTIPIAGLLWSRPWRVAAVASIAEQPALAIAGLGAASLTAIYNFDLGFPHDVDLMTTMSAPVGLVLLQVALCAPAAMRPWLWGAMFVNGTLAWSLMASLLVTPTESGRGDLLAVNRRTGEIRLRDGEGATITVSLPPQGKRPFRLEVHAWLGELPALEGLEPPPVHGMRFPTAGTPGADAQRSILIAHPDRTAVIDHATSGLEHDWASPPLPAVRWFGAWTVQALLRDADGNAFATNFVRILP